MLQNSAITAFATLILVSGILAVVMRDFGDFARFMVSLFDRSPGRAVFRAAKQGNAAAVGDASSGAVNTSATSPSGMTALNIAAREGHLEVCRALVKAGTDIDATSEPRAGTVLEATSPRTFHEDTNGGAFGNAGYTALYLASERGHEDVVSFLLENGANPNRGRTVLDEDGGTHRILPDTYPLFRAVTLGHSDIVSSLLLAGAAVDARCAGQTALHIAARLSDQKVAFGTKGKIWKAGISKCLELLISSGADVNAQVQGEGALEFEIGRTALHITRSASAAKKLLEFGADPTIRDKGGISALKNCRRLARKDKGLRDLLDKVDGK